MKLAFLIINGPDLSWVSGYLQNIRMPSPLSIPVSQPDRPAVVWGGHVCACVHLRVLCLWLPASAIPCLQASARTQEEDVRECCLTAGSGQ